MKHLNPPPTTCTPSDCPFFPKIQALLKEGANAGVFPWEKQWELDGERVKVGLDP